jgi:hypothetical protein
LFIIIVKTLQSDMEAGVQYLQESVKGLKITNFDVENVSRVINAYKHHKGIGKNKVPEEFLKRLVTIFQTSAAPEFKEVFSHVQRNAELHLLKLVSIPRCYSTSCYRLLGARASGVKRLKIDSKLLVVQV